MEQAKTFRSNLKIRLRPVSIKQDTSEYNNRMSAIQVPLRLDVDTFKSMNGNKTVSNFGNQMSNKNESRSNTPLSDSGFCQSEQDNELKSPPRKISSDRSVSSLRDKLDSSSGTSLSDNFKFGSEEDKTFVQTRHLDLNVPDKSVTPDTETQRYNERCISSQKQANQDVSTPRLGHKSKSNRQKETFGDQVTSKKQNTYLSKSTKKDDTSAKNNKRKELQWLDLKSSSTEEKLQKEKTNVTSRTSYNTTTGSETEWNLIEKEMRRLKTKGYDPDMAMIALLSTFANAKTTSRLDWRMLTKSIAQTGTASNNDFFSVYPWSMRRRENTSSRLGDYLQQVDHVDQGGDTPKPNIENKKPPKGKKHFGPSGVKFMQSPRGYIKKEKSKTPGEVALDEARYKNSKRYKIGTEEIMLPKCKTSSSLPSLTSANSATSHSTDASRLTLPEIPNYRPTTNGKIYSGIYRLATPPVFNRNGMVKTASTQSLESEIGKESFPLQVKNCGIPNSEALSFSPMLKSYITRSTTDIYSESTFPMLVMERNNSSESRTSNHALSVYPISKEHKNKHKVILQTFYSRSIQDPPKPPPVTPNVKQGRMTMSAEEMDSFMKKYKMVFNKTQTPVCSRRSSYVPEHFSDFDSSEESESYIDDAGSEDGDEDKSSIHSLSTVASDNHKL